MDKSSYISIQGTNDKYNDFVRFMTATTNELKKSADTLRVDFSKCQGEKLENVVLNHMKELAINFNFNPKYIIHTEKQHFPDIVSENYFGVEVKATKEKTWSSTGSSITESLREDCVKKVFLLFGRLSIPEVEFRCKPYEDCMYDISVTHNPRYLINMDLDNTDKTIFDKLGVPYDDFRLNNNRINIIRDYYRNKYRGNEKEMPWWIDEETNNVIVQDTGSIRLYSSVTKNEKDYLKWMGFILFPEILSSDYSRLALWLCSRYSIVNPNIRDMYSAGGQMNIYINGKLHKKSAAKSISNLLMSIDKIRDIFLKGIGISEEISYYSSYSSMELTPYVAWKRHINSYTKKLVDLDIDTILQLTIDKIEDNNVI